MIETLTGGVAGLFKKNKIDLIEGHGSLTDDGNVVVGGSFDGNEIEAGKVVLATGSVSKPLLDLEFGDRILDTAACWHLGEQPKRLAVIGAGASGSEIASAFGRMGTEVTLLEALPQILPLEDEEIARHAAREIKKQNVEIVTDANVEGAEAGKSSVKVTFGGDSHEFDYLCIAAGRAPDVEELGLDKAGVKTDDRGPRRGGRAAAHVGRERLRDRRPGPRARRSPTRPPTRASSRSRTPPATTRTRSPTTSSRPSRSATRRSPASA